MITHPSKLNKIFGSGPAGLLTSIVLFFVAYELNERVRPAPLTENQLIPKFAFLVSVVATITVILWSLRSLPASERGCKLVTRGAFEFVRHPLYAAFLSVFNFGLAVYLNSYIFVVWAILLHPVWHYVIRYEERLMLEVFGQSYVEYQKKTGRFFPRLRYGFRWLRQPR